MRLACSPIRKAGSKESKGITRLVQCLSHLALESPEGRPKPRRKTITVAGTTCKSRRMFVRWQNELAKKVLTEFPTKRITKQIAPDGRQPRELVHPSVELFPVQLEALFDAASIADKLGIDLWNYETQDKRGIRKALDWLLPFATGAKKWNYQQISALQPENSRHF